MHFYWDSYREFAQRTECVSGLTSNSLNYCLSPIHRPKKRTKLNPMWGNPIPWNIVKRRGLKSFRQLARFMRIWTVIIDPCGILKNKSVSQMEMEMKVAAGEEKWETWRAPSRVSFELWQLLSSHIWNNEAHGSRSRELFGFYAFLIWVWFGIRIAVN